LKLDPHNIRALLGLCAFAIVHNDEELLTASINEIREIDAFTRGTLHGYACNKRFTFLLIVASHDPNGEIDALFATIALLQVGLVPREQ
jgi:hypothetical protein